ncbi:MAG: hypothetical protein LBV01_05970 [Deltaproteobacteria bacterium]|nr:hypothetical protein [Deltaproteobacteria bacterium]
MNDTLGPVNAADKRGDPDFEGARFKPLPQKRHCLCPCCFHGAVVKISPQSGKCHLTGSRQRSRTDYTQAKGTSIYLKYKLFLSYQATTDRALALAVPALHQKQVFSSSSYKKILTGIFEKIVYFHKFSLKISFSKNAPEPKITLF